MTAAAHPLHVGSRTIVVHTVFRDEAGGLVALVIQTQAVLDGSPAAAERDPMTPGGESADRPIRLGGAGA